MEKRFKLRIYKSSGVFDYEEFFKAKKELVDRYELFMSYRMNEPLPTAWELVNGEWNRLGGY